MLPTDQGGGGPTGPRHHECLFICQKQRTTYFWTNMHPGVRKGKVAEYWTVTKLIGLGYNVAIPVADDGSDLWTETQTGVLRVQVKLAQKKRRGNRLIWRLSCGGNSKVCSHLQLFDYLGRIDLFIVVHPNLVDCWILPPEQVAHLSANHNLRAEDLNRWDRLGAPKEPLESVPNTVEQCVFQWNRSDPLPSLAGLAGGTAVHAPLMRSRLDTEHGRP